MPIARNKTGKRQILIWLVTYPFQNTQNQKAWHRHKLTASTGHQWLIAAMQPRSFHTFLYRTSSTATPFLVFLSTTAASSFHSNRVYNRWRTSVLPAGRSARSSHWGSMCCRTAWSQALLLMWIRWTETLSMRVDGEKKNIPCVTCVC